MHESQSETVAEFQMKRTEKRRRFGLQSIDDSGRDVQIILSTNKRCIGCSSNSYEQKQWRNGVVPDYQNVSFGLFCTCNKYLCKECVFDIYPLIQEYEGQFHQSCSKYLKGLESFVKKKRHPNRSMFLGHCCFIKRYVQIKECTKLNRMLALEKDRMLPRKTLAGGAVVNPEFGLVIPTCFESVDVIGQAKEKNLPGRQHFVLDELETSINERDECPQPKILDPSNLPCHWKYIYIRQKVQLPHGKRVSMFCVFSHIMG